MEGWDAITRFFSDARYFATYLTDGRIRVGVVTSYFTDGRMWLSQVILHVILLLVGGLLQCICK